MLEGIAYVLDQIITSSLCYEQGQLGYDRETKPSPVVTTGSSKQQMIQEIRLLKEQVTALKASRQKIS